ncbi:sugar phosphate isomerase/epimerase family protein [Paenibacillus albus]|uniref:Sugar phosphate isomerase/epimerase n=1 Tax=Paenibacillus albus TaxID=2495582 RepID=A0A3Q8X3C5_9BACL|nr:sugar phosphate isomerase/epimerase [Paenibacillus albus]AZN38260.1 sugar phosphate isomerase/epimerase [Paenibacillus albus]
MTIACSTSIRCGSSLHVALQTVAELGFHAVDLLAIDGWVHVNPSDLASDWEGTLSRLDEQLTAHGLVPLALNTGTGPQLHDRSNAACARRQAEIAALIRLMQRYGVQLAAIQPRNNDVSRPWSLVLADCVATLREYDAAARTAGVEFALELHINSPFETLEQARALVAAMPEVKLVYDPSHFVMQGIDIRETEWLMEHAVHVHVRDAARDRMQTHLGEGDVDLDWMLGTLARRGYRGHFSIEYLEDGEMDVLGDVIGVRDAILRYFPEGEAFHDGER